MRSYLLSILLFICALSAFAHANISCPTGTEMINSPARSLCVTVTAKKVNVIDSSAIEKPSI